MVKHIAQNKAVLRHPRRYYVFDKMLHADWEETLCDGFSFRRVNEELLGEGLVNTERVSSSIDDSWSIRRLYFEKGIGFCITRDKAIVSTCITDCVIGKRCELGVWTDPAFRKLGLSSAVTAGTVEYCLSQGIKDIGWQTLKTNTGSIKVAEKVGFSHICDYTAFSSELIAANHDNLTREEWKGWAKAYSYLPEQDGLTRFRQAECWAHSGEAEQALTILEGLIDS